MNPAWKSSSRSTVARAWIAAAQEPPALKGVCELIFGNKNIEGTISGTASAIPRAKAGVCRHKRSARSRRLSDDCWGLVGISGSESSYRYGVPRAYGSRQTVSAGGVQFSRNSQKAEHGEGHASIPEKPGPSTSMKLS